MIGIGIRVYSNSNVFYTIIEQDENVYNYLNISNIVILLIVVYSEMTDCKSEIL